MSAVEIEIEKLKQLFDLIVGSLNFGSGFLDRDDIDLLREVAGLIGVDPMVGTSTEFVTSYPHAFKRYEQGGDSICYYCGRRPSEPIHARRGAEGAPVTEGETK